MSAADDPVPPSPNPAGDADADQDADAVAARRPGPPALAPKDAARTVPDSRTLLAEVWLVLWVSIAASGLRSFVSLVDSLTKGTPLRQQTTTLITTYVVDRPWLDFMYQATRIGLALVPVLLVVHLMRRSGEGPRTIGLDFRDWKRDLARGAMLAAGIGGVGLVFYLIAYNMGFSVRIAAVTLEGGWWNAAYPILYAAYNAVVEEVIVLAYLLHRADQLGWKPWKALATSSLLRGAYHLYQGFGGFIGNIAMGLVFGLLYRRWRRVMPFVIAHFLIDAVAFVGYALLGGKVSWLP